MSIRLVGLLMLLPSETGLPFSNLDIINGITKKFHEGYMRRLSYLDRQIGKSLQILRDNGMLDDASVIVTSDHGQFFGEHSLLYL